MQKGEAAFPSISPDDRGKLVKILLYHMIYFDLILLTCTF